MGTIQFCVHACYYKFWGLNYIIMFVYQFGMLDIGVPSAVQFYLSETNWIVLHSFK
jgi:hypothetical protein